MKSWPVLNECKLELLLIIAALYHPASILLGSWALPQRVIVPANAHSETAA